jgi:hypothetical protein
LIAARRLAHDARHAKRASAITNLPVGMRVRVLARCDLERLRDDAAGECAAGADSTERAGRCERGSDRRRSERAA